MTTVSPFEYKLLGFMLFLMAVLSAVVGALCVVNYMHGHTLRAASSLILPAALLYWKWSDYTGARTDGEIIRWYGAAWFVGLLLGLLAGALRVLFA